MNPDFDAVVFDFGGVLTSSPVNLMASKAAEAGVNMADFMELMLGPLDEDTDHPFHRLERGEVTIEALNELLGQLSSEAGNAGTPVRLPDESEILGALAPVPAMVELVTDLRQHGYRTAILTNNVREWGSWSKIIDVHSLVHEVIQSWEVGMRKPSPAIYNLTLDKVGVVEPARCLFLDDFIWNIRGADAVGLTTMHVTDHAETVRATRALLLDGR